MDPHPPSRGRGRPPGAGVVDDDDLLERAMHALAAGGYRALSMRGLARDLGVSLRSIQHRHETKDDLWRAAVDHAIDRSPAFAGDDAVPAVLRRRIAEAQAYPGLMASLLTDDAPGHEQRLAYVIERLRPSFTLAKAKLVQGREAGLTRDIDVGVLIATMLVGVGAMAALPDALCAELGLSGDPSERLAEGLADLVLFGVVARD